MLELQILWYNCAITGLKCHKNTLQCFAFCVCAVFGMQDVKEAGWLSLKKMCGKVVENMNKEVDKDHKKYLGAIGAWALAFGCSVGWGWIIS